MNPIIDLKEHLPENFSPESRVWIYQCNRRFLISEALELQNIFEAFTASWHSHGATVKGFANLFYGQFIVIMADETQTGVSGCSTDSSVRMIKEIQEKFNVDLFNRQVLAFLVKDKIELLPLAQLKYALENNHLNADTLYFNNTVSTRAALETSWLVPLKNSWLSSKLDFAGR